MISAHQQKRDGVERSFLFKMLMEEKKTVMQYWLTDGMDWPTLQQIALKVFSLPASSAASERNFSTFGFIHSKLRNRLQPNKVEQLVYIKSNNFHVLDSS